MAATSHNTVLDLPLTAATPDAASTVETDARAKVLQLFDECRDGVYRYALSFGLEQTDSEDAVQEVFLALFQHLTRGGARTNLRGWVFRVTRNVALKRRERRSRVGRWIVACGVMSECVDPGTNPEERLFATRRQARLHAVVRALPDRDRQCLQLRVEGLRYREIAWVLGVSLGTVASSLARVVARMHRAAGAEG